MSIALQTLQDLEPSTEDFRAAVFSGLRRRQKSLPSKFLYDAEGSRLFERICELPEYYPTRTEFRILRAHAGEIARLVGRDARLVEFGSGAGVKIRLLLNALDQPAAYIPVDISRHHLLAAAASLARDFPQLPIAPVCADYTAPFVLPARNLAPGRYTVGFFPGSTIGNFTRPQARAFLRGAKTLLGEDSSMIVGVDLRKEPGVLIRAYDDSAGVTAAFNLNILRRINREIGGGFALDRFVHQARWNAPRGRIEMHLASVCDQSVEVGAERFAFRARETIHTENSCKYSLAEFRALAQSAGYETRAVWIDDAELFSLHFLRSMSR